MSEWKEVKLNDVCELIVDCPHSTAPDEGHGYPLIRTPNIGKGRLILDGVHRVSKDIFDTRNARAVPKPYDLILRERLQLVMLLKFRKVRKCV